MKNNTLTLSIFSLALLLIGLTGCGDDKPTPTPVEYTVTFDANEGKLADGSARSTVKVKSGEKVATPTPPPTRAGFSFVEWRKTGANTAVGNAFSFTTETITADITLTAQWVKAHTVTFDPGTGGTLTSPATVQVADGEKLTTPTLPTKVGSTFTGWQKADGTAVGNAFAFDTETITADITLTAQWEKIQYTVTFDLRGGMFASGTATTVQVTYGEKVATPTPPTKVGSTFAGWQTTNGTAFAFTTETITANTTITAQWTLQYNDLTDLTKPASLLRGWMQRATTNAHSNSTNRRFTGGTSQTTDAVVVNIDGARFNTIVYAPTTSNGEAASTQTGIPSTERGNVNTDRTLDFADLFGTGKTADGYAVRGDTLYITQNQATLAIMVINSTPPKGIFVKAGNADGLLLLSDNDANPSLNNREWMALVVDKQAYTGMSSTSVTNGGSSTSGIDSKLTFFVNLNNQLGIDSIVFTQSDLPANRISDINDGIIVARNSISNIAHDQWPNLRDLFLDVYPDFTSRNTLDIVSFTNVDVYILNLRFVTPGGDIEVTFLPGRNATTPAEEIKVIYKRPSN